MSKMMVLALLISIAGLPPAQGSSSSYPIQGIAYAPLTCADKNNCPASEDMAQDGYKSQWGSSGRDDLGIMQRMGANYIRLYHPIGDETPTQPDHTGFLDAAHEKGLKVFAAVHQYLRCDGSDCYQSWYGAVKEGLKKGFQTDGQWHPAVWTVNMINEVDAMGNDPYNQVHKLISSIDGLIKAEKEAGITNGVNLTSCFTTAIAQPLGGGKSTIYHGFTSMENWMNNPSLASYQPRSVSSVEDLAKEIDRRWVHCINAQIPWHNGLDGMVANQYPYTRPWFLGEMGWNGIHQDAMLSDLNTMQEFAKQDKGFIGTFVFQFQTAYQKGNGPELNFGLFGLGQKKLALATDVDEKSFDVRCLTTRLWAFEQPWGCGNECNHRAQTVAKAFGGNISGDGVCSDDVPLGPTQQAAEVMV